MEILILIFLKIVLTGILTSSGVKLKVAKEFMILVWIPKYTFACTVRTKNNTLTKKVDRMVTINRSNHPKQSKSQLKAN